MKADISEQCKVVLAQVKLSNDLSWAQKMEVLAPMIKELCEQFNAGSASQSQAFISKLIGLSNLIMVA